jgi:YHS domain-containing protein
VTQNKKEGATMAKDPVCGMEVEEKKAAGTAEYDGKTYYFCSSVCKAKFEKSPRQYAKE